MKDTIEITVFCDTTDLYSAEEIEGDNLCSLVFPLETVKEYYECYKEDGAVDFDEWLNIYTADETAGLYAFAKSKSCNILKEAAA